MEDSHLLLELPARSAKEEKPLLAHAGHGIAPHVPHKSWWLWEPLTWDKEGKVALWTWYKVAAHFPIHLLSFNLFKRKSLAQRVSPPFPQMKLGLLIHPILLVG